MQRGMGGTDKEHPWGYFDVEPECEIDGDNATMSVYIYAYHWTGSGYWNKQIHYVSGSPSVTGGGIYNASSFWMTTGTLDSAVHTEGFAEAYLIEAWGASHAIN
jgi:hypothetical protein